MSGVQILGPAACWYHLHLDTLLTLSSHSTGHVQFATIELASALVMTNLGHRRPDGVVLIKIYTNANNN